MRVLDPLELDDAMQLFASRAADSDGDFVLDDASAASVAAICTNVDRLPLAIELTAARTRAFSAQQLAELLDHRFGLVSTANSRQAATPTDDARGRRLELRPVVRRRTAAADPAVGVRRRFHARCRGNGVRRRLVGGRPTSRCCWPVWSTSHWSRPRSDRAPAHDFGSCDPLPTTPQPASTSRGKLP